MGDSQLFGARLRVDAGGAHGVLVADVAQRVAQGLAALAEGGADDVGEALAVVDADQRRRSEEHTSELQSLMRISYAVFCLKQKKSKYTPTHTKTYSIRTPNTTYRPYHDNTQT